MDTTTQVYEDEKLESLATDGGLRGDNLSREALFTALSNQRRRYALHYLLTHPNGVSLRELTSQVAAWENGCTPEELTRQQRKRVYSALHQIHLPKLHQLELVTYDSSRGTLDLRANPKNVARYLDVPDDDSRWWQLTAALGGLLTAAFGGMVAGVVPVSITVATVGMVLSLLVLGVATTRVLDRPRSGTDGLPPEVREQLFDDLNAESTAESGDAVTADADEPLEEPSETAPLVQNLPQREE